MLRTQIIIIEIILKIIFKIMLKIIVIIIDKNNNNSKMRFSRNGVVWLIDTRYRLASHLHESMYVLNKQSLQLF